LKRSGKLFPGAGGSNARIAGIDREQAPVGQGPRANTLAASRRTFLPQAGTIFGGCCDGSPQAGFVEAFRGVIAVKLILYKTTRRD
jgi:hypothetical protein